MEGERKESEFCAGDSCSNVFMMQGKDSGLQFMPECETTTTDATDYDADFV